MLVLGVRALATFDRNPSLCAMSLLRLKDFYQYIMVHLGKKLPQCKNRVIHRKELGSGKARVRAGWVSGVTLSGEDDIGPCAANNRDGGTQWL